MAREFEVDFKQDELKFVFFTRDRNHQDTAMQSLRSDLTNILCRDARLGQGRKFFKWVDQEGSIIWDDALERMIAYDTVLGPLAEIRFQEANEAAVFRLAYCADGKFQSEWRTF